MQQKHPVVIKMYIHNSYHIRFVAQGLFASAFPYAFIIHFRGFRYFGNVFFFEIDASAHHDARLAFYVALAPVVARDV